MRKTLLAVVLAGLLLTSTALAEVYEGTTVAAASVPMEAATGGTLVQLNTILGSIVQEGDIIGAVRATKVFAAQDGTVARINAEEGDTVEGAVLELSPVEKYKIYCTVDKAYESPENMLLHSGEQLYMKCTNDGTHRGIGQVTQINGDEFYTLAIGGELYIGETVYLYREDGFASSQRVGIGTVANNDTEIYEAEGKIVRMHVSEGEYVERGELLYEWVEADGTDLIAPLAGIVTEVAVRQGDAVEKGQTLLTIAPQNRICVEIMVDESAAAAITPGAKVELIYTADPTETSAVGTVTEISYIAENEVYAVRIQPENTENLKLGMTVTVRTEME